MNGIYGDRTLMPTLPGLSDAGSCSNWETGIPIDLEKIRDKDELYWSKWRGTPKAFINYSTGRELWANRFGASTAIRLDSELYEKDEIISELQRTLKPEKFGFRLQAVKNEGMAAARGGVDFAQLFLGMSFFLLIAGLTLIALLFNIHLERRMQQIGTLKAMGYPDRLVRKLILYEEFFVAFGGVILGGLLAIWYNKLIFRALNTMWSDIVRTSVLSEDIRIKTLLTGMIISFLLAYITILYNLYRKLKVEPSRLQRGVTSQRWILSIKWINWIAWISGVTAAVILVNELILAEGLNAGAFFMAGGLLLLSFILFYTILFYRQRIGKHEDLSLSYLAINNLQRNRARSIRIVVLFSLGTFVIVSTGLNQKDLYSDANNKNSGTGGYNFYAETTMPVLTDLNDPETQVRYGFETAVEFVQMRINDGDDASCLNLNRITHPRILGIPSDELKNRFSFVKTSDEFDPGIGWESLKLPLPGGVVPGIADQTVIQWGLGKKVGDTIVYKNESGIELHVKLIAGLANSIFQGNILIDEELFLNHFPSSSGVNVFLVNAHINDNASVERELERSFRNSGLELVYAADRLAEFNSVENTYLSIFLLLGGLGMILGTIGLGLSLLRNIQDRQQELAILRAIGYKKRSILNMLTIEHIILLGIGTIIGSLSAFVATIPSIFSEFVEASWQTATGIVFLIMLNGLIWIFFIGKSSLRKNLVAALRSE
jgi:ABC-type antimicrobial peptide transport system permease subunit